MESNYGFCEAGSLANEIYSLLASNLLGEDQYEKIVTRYGDMRINFNNYPRDFVKDGRSDWSFSEGLEPFKPEKWDRYYWDTTAVPIPITHPDFVDLVSRTERRGAIGLDFPTWFSSSGNKPYIMLVAQDPLRDADWYGDKKDSCYLCTDAVVSTPFGLHDAHHREHGNGGKRVWLLVQTLLKKYAEKAFPTAGSGKRICFHTCAERSPAGRQNYRSWQRLCECRKQPCVCHKAGTEVYY